MTPSGQRFLFVAPVEAGRTSRFTLLNWQRELTQ